MATSNGFGVIALLCFCFNLLGLEVVRREERISYWLHLKTKGRHIPGEVCDVGPWLAPYLLKQLHVFFRISVLPLSLELLWTSVGCKWESSCLVCCRDLTALRPRHTQNDWHHTRYMFNLYRVHTMATLSPMVTVEGGSVRLGTPSPDKAGCSQTVRFSSSKFYRKRCVQIHIDCYHFPYPFTTPLRGFLNRHLLSLDNLPVNEFTSKYLFECALLHWTVLDIFFCCNVVPQTEMSSADFLPLHVVADVGPHESDKSQVCFRISYVQQVALLNSPKLDIVKFSLTCPKGCSLVGGNVTANR